MTKGYRINVEGLEELRQRLETLVDEVRAGAVEAIRESGEAVKDDMTAAVPVDSGDLRASIRSEVNKANLVAEVGPRGSDVYYGYFVEFGTSSMAAQPYAAPAAEAERAKFADRLRKHVGDELDKW